MLIGARTNGGLVEVRVLTGGSSYESPPAVVIAGGGGTGASAVAVMAGTRVDSVIITNSGTGYTSSPTVAFTAATGSGAAATAYAYTGPLRPMSFFKGRFGVLYGVDGMGRGVRWEAGSTAVSPIGLHKPAIGPAVTAATTTAGNRVSSIQMVDGGNGYSRVPSVALTGGTPTTPARAQAVLVNGRVTGVQVTDPGAGYASAPAVSFSGGLGTSAAFTVNALGGVAELRIVSAGTQYSAATDEYPVITVATSNGLTGFESTLAVDQYGRIVGASILNAGTGATTTPGFSVTAVTGSGCALEADMTYSIQSVSVAHSGVDYLTPPFVTIRNNADDRSGGGGEVEATVNAAGNISAVTVLAGGSYRLPPTALVLNTEARAQASLAASLRGKYLCAIRYVDSTAAVVGGPLASSISHLVEVDAEDGSGTLTWAFSHPHLDDRVYAMELWRSSGDQALLLFRVATILRTDGNWGGTYVDTMPDRTLTDSARDHYGLMPITLPSGQVNARRFTVPTGRMAVGVMFQDRAWYAVDTSGTSPNSLYYSEVDEPESVPEANELVVQENTDTPDRIVALVPVGVALLVVQTSHLYRLMYVAQPVLDASIMLSAHRGVLNNRCWAVMAGVAFLVDSVGMYAFDGDQEQSVSVTVDDYWRSGKIDLSKADKFHVHADFLTRTVRFHYCQSGDTEPVRALCYCTATQAWWEELYPTAVTAGSAAVLAGQRRLAMGGVDGVWRKESGTQDGSTAIAYSVRTGNMLLGDDQDRSITVVYEPTAGDSDLNLSLHYNNSTTARPNAVHSDPGGGFTVSAGGAATLNMKKTRSPLGDATGVATAHRYARRDERSAGGDKHVAVHLNGAQANDAVTLFALRVAGAE